ncbi:MAG: ferredoxin [Actinomycetota bacterium]|nr:ferredoxin [Actinomycetota bacterium]
MTGGLIAVGMLPAAARLRAALCFGKGTTSMRVTLNYAACHGHQSCAIAAPEVFGADELGNAVVLIDGDLPEALHAKARRAAGNCPEHAIAIEE